MLFYLIPLGIIYDVIVEPPSIGSTTDERGNSKPVSIIYRLMHPERSLLVKQVMQHKITLGAHYLNCPYCIQSFDCAYVNLFNNTHDKLL